MWREYRVQPGNSSKLNKKERRDIRQGRSPDTVIVKREKDREQV